MEGDCHMKRIALILAGGVGTRSGEKIPKQFVEINRKPLIVYTLEKFQESNSVDGIVVTCVENWIPRLEEYVREFNISKVLKVVKGGKNGLDSVKNGLNALSMCSDEDLVLIHDAVRPFVDVSSIEENIRVASQYGLALTAVDLLETLVYSEDGIVGEKVVDRDKLKRILTPQTFNYKLLKELYADDSKLNPLKYPSTFSLYMSTGAKVYCSKGSEKNIKITYPEDIQYFKKMFGS